MNGARLDVVVVSWNTMGALGDCLSSLEDAAGAGAISVTVVDNGSSDGSTRMVAREHPWATLAQAGANLGFGGAVNLGAERGGAPWIAAANADVVVPLAAIDALLDLTAAAAADVGAIAPRLAHPSGAVQPSVFSFPRVSDTALAALGVHRVSAAARRRLRIGPSAAPPAPCDVEYAMGAFLVLRRSAFEAIGGFDDGQWLYAEDLDLCWRLRRAGWRTRYEPGATVVHIGGAATSVAFAPAELRARTLAASYSWVERRRGLAAAAAIHRVQLLGAILRVGAVRARRGLGRGGPAPTAAEDWLPIVRRAWRLRGAQPDAAGSSP
ncbi:MAG TPA: glycosyltransferase [Solirubrobacterales bacterium]|nr:glycosyltransferase [Solirubrobacterales bacterium]